MSFGTLLVLILASGRQHITLLHVRLIDSLDIPLTFKLPFKVLSRLSLGSLLSVLASWSLAGLLSVLSFLLSDFSPRWEIAFWCLG